MIDWMKYRWLYLLISLSVIGSGLLAYFKWGLVYGIDFTGGEVLEYRLTDGQVKTFKYPPESVEKLIQIRRELASQGG